MIPFPFQLMFSPPPDIRVFRACVTPANAVDHDFSGLPYPPRLVWWKYIKEETKTNVDLYPFSIETNSPILFYRSNIKTIDWNKEHLHAAIIPNEAEAVMICKVDLKEEEVVFRFDPLFYPMDQDTQHMLAYDLRPMMSAEDVKAIGFIMLIIAFLVIMCYLV